MMLVKLVEEIDLNEAYQFLQSDAAGAVNVFVGTVRNHSKDKEVVKLVFEAYESMAVKELEKVATRAMERWSLDKVVIIHATGEKLPGEAVVITGASSAHRKASFEACEFLIDELKKTVPIWKHEHFIDGSEWVNAHP
jgi:molybdopterin synthase catalytic subunit